LSWAPVSPSSGADPMTTEEFIRLHSNDSVADLALHASRWRDVDMPYALEQIEGWQRARAKLPTWAATEGIVYPPHLALEQCSSESAARYKAGVVSRLLPADGSFIDLTGGLGVDFYFVGQLCHPARLTYVERQKQLCEVASHNFSCLGLQAEVVCGDGVDYLHRLRHASVVFLDPARRDAHGGKTVAIADCQPDVLALRDELLQKADAVVVKLSPMLDWHEAVLQLGIDVVSEVHIVSVGGECKELLFVMRGEGSKKPSDGAGKRQLFCADDGKVFEATSGGAVRLASDVASVRYFYEPNASIMKAGCFGALCREFPVEAVAANSHLFVSQEWLPEFPGRKFRLLEVLSFGKQDMRSLSSLSSANITVRNFPMTVAALRKRLHLKDGGSDYLFATTLSNGKKVVLHGVKEEG
jgi:hypothetical protein